MKRLADPISAAALAYLATPSLVFLIGWLEPVPGLVLSALLGIALLQLTLQQQSRSIASSLRAMLALMSIAAAWAAFSGGSHFFFANPDWRTRDTVYADLILSSWPPSYGFHEGSHLVLRTAFGYFLPPALLSKLMGLDWAPVILWFWTATGVALFMMLLPLPARLGPRLLILCFVVIFFSGMDFPAILLIHGHMPVFPLPLEWWRPWTYTSLTGQLFWAPNHALALWLGTALFFRHRADERLPALSVLLFPMLLLWTPFAVIGLLPWFVWGIAKLCPSPLAGFRKVTICQWLALAGLCATTIALFSRPGLGVHYALPDPGGNAVKADNVTNWIELISGYWEFAFFEFGLLAALLRPIRPDLRQAQIIATAILLLLPLVRLGPSNDWLLRVSTPSLLMLLLLTLGEFNAELAGLYRSRRLTALVAVLLLGAITPYFEFARAILWTKTPPNYGFSLLEQNRGFLAPHYVGVLDKAILQSLFRTPAPVPDSAARQRIHSPALHSRP